jgi:uncharacterized protein
VAENFCIYCFSHDLHVFFSSVFLIILFVLIASVAIESCRYNSSYETLGFSFRVSSALEALIGFFFPPILFTIIAVVIAISGMSQKSVQLVPFSDINFYFYLEVTGSIFIFAFLEELIFRGIVFQAFLQRFSPIRIVLGFSLVFTFLHLFNIPGTYNIVFILNVFLANTVLSVMYLNTLSLWMPVSFHFSWNLFQALILNSPVSGFNYSIPLMKIKFTNLSPFLFGGEFGLEGGIIATLILIISLFFILKLFKPSPYIASKVFIRDFSNSYPNNLDPIS